MPEYGTVLIAAGGTGGHVYPAMAVAEILRQRNVPVVWLGTRAGLEAQVVPAGGFDIEWISVTALRGKNFLATLMAPLKLLRACFESLRIYRRRKPAVVLGMGGFVSGPGCLVALLLRLPFCIHEQNSVAGMTNRYMARFSKNVFTAFPGVFDDIAVREQVGNPVRQDIENIAPPEQRLGQREGPVRLLVIGGSHGAQALNQQVPLMLASLGQNAGSEVDIWHQSGKTQYDNCVECYAESGIAARADIRVDAFIDDMAEAYGWADLVICRAGAMTVSELTAVGVASVLIPYPHAVDDHQSANARWLVDGGAAVLLQQSDLHGDNFAAVVQKLVADRSQLLQMSVSARALFRQGSAQRVADALQEYSVAV